MFKFVLCKAMNKRSFSASWKTMILMRSSKRQWETMSNNEKQWEMVSIIITSIIIAWLSENIWFVRSNSKPSSNQGQTRGLSHQFFVQLSAQNLSQILNVWVKVWTKHTQMRQKRIFVKLQFGQVTIRIIPSTPYFALFNHIKTVPTVRPIYFTRGGDRNQGSIYWRNSTFSLQSDTFGKRLRCLTNVCYLKLKKKTLISGQTQIIWVGWGLWVKHFTLVAIMVLWRKSL